MTVDNTVPTLSVNVANPVNAATSDPTPLVATATDTGSGIANVSFEQCTVANDDSCAADTWISLGVDTTPPYAVAWAIPADGTRLLRVRATDNAGRQTAELVLTTVDRTRPTGSVTVPAAGANLRGAAVALSAVASDTAPGTVNTVTFQRSPAGAGTWTDISVDATPPYNATLDTTGLADGLYDLRVFTTDSAGNAEATPATVQVRVDNTLPTGTVTLPADTAAIRGTVALTSNSADAGGSGVDTVQFQRSPVGAGTWTNQARQLEHDCAERRPVRPPRRDDRQRRQRLYLGGDHRSGRQHQSDRLRHGAGRRGQPPRHRRADEQLRRRAARASRPSSSSARRSAQAPGRTRRRAGTRTTSVTASTTSAS